MMTLPDFENTQIAFSHLDDRSLQRAYYLYRSFHKTLLKIGSPLLEWALKYKIPILWLIRRTFFAQFCGGENLLEALEFAKRLEQKNVGSVLDFAVEGQETDDDTQLVYQEMTNVIQAVQTLKHPFAVFKMSALQAVAQLERYSKNFAEIDKTLLQRTQFLAELCSTHGVSLMIDAEESWIQDAVDLMAISLMRRFNQSRPVVYQTLQMYRKDRIDELQRLIQLAKSEKFVLAIKLVRGAYLEKENAHAQERGVPSPLYGSKKETDLAFDTALEMCLREGVFVVVGTHNEESTRLACERVRGLDIPPGDKRVYFSQLLGMSDNLSFNLASEGYNVLKYVPYGPVAQALPYLLRRAYENQSVIGQASRQLKLILREMTRRKTLP